MEVSKYSPKTNTPLLEKPSPMRSPEDMVAAHNSEVRAIAYLGAAIDFLNEVTLDAERKTIRHHLGLDSKP